MNFQDTLTALYAATEQITVYACPAYSYANGVRTRDIGIRAYIVGQPNHDPIIDDRPFMICGDIYRSGHERVSDFSTFAYAGKSINTWACTVYLRAVSGWPTATISLGEYRIMDMSQLADDVIQLDLERA